MWNMFPQLWWLHNNHRDKFFLKSSSCLIAQPPSGFTISDQKVHFWLQPLKKMDLQRNETYKDKLLTDEVIVAMT